MLRPVLACRWIEADLGAVPVRFEALVEGLDLLPELCEAVAELLTKKRAGQELDEGPRIPVLSRFLKEEVERLKTAAGTAAPAPGDTDSLDALFRECLRDAWAGGVFP